jgi:hypothetical protein
VNKQFLQVDEFKTNMSGQFKTLTEKITETCQETLNELLEPDCTNDVKINWIKHVLSGIETTNEIAEESGFMSIYTGPFKIDNKVDLDQQVKHYTNLLVQTIRAANDSYHQKDIDETRNLMNKNLSEIVKDPVFSCYTIKELMAMPFGQLLEKYKCTTKSKLQRMHWEGHLEEILHMLDSFEEERDSDVDSSCSEEDL